MIWFYNRKNTIICGFRKRKLLTGGKQLVL